MLYILNRPEGEYFTPAAEIDPVYAELLKKAYEERRRGASISR